MLRKQSHPPSRFREREHYLVFGPITFTCPYTEKACALIQKNRDRCWQRKQNTPKTLYFPNDTQPRKAKSGRQYETWPQIYFWNTDLQKYRYIGGYTNLMASYGKQQRHPTYATDTVAGCNACSS